MLTLTTVLKAAVLLPAAAMAVAFAVVPVLRRRRRAAAARSQVRRRPHARTPGLFDGEWLACIWPEEILGYGPYYLDTVSLDRPAWRGHGGWVADPDRMRLGGRRVVRAFQQGRCPGCGGRLRPSSPGGWVRCDASYASGPLTTGHDPIEYQLRPLPAVDDRLHWVVRPVPAFTPVRPFHRSTVEQAWTRVQARHAAQQRL